MMRACKVPWGRLGASPTPGLPGKVRVNCSLKNKKGLASAF